MGSYMTVTYILKTKPISNTEPILIRNIYAAIIFFIHDICIVAEGPYLP